VSLKTGKNLFEAMFNTTTGGNKMQARIGVPTMRGIQDSLIDYAVGLGGGVIYALSNAFTGSGLLGGLIGAGLAGSVVRGSRGTAIATILGFQSIIGTIGNTAAVTNDGNEGVM
tara:strand:+ start:4615 stop:4956 length:342 start_codon:yes stop_codon:yes gene_type:complete